MHGLIRVRQFTISEGHLILHPEQLEEEFKGCVELAKFMLETLDLTVTFHIVSHNGIRQILKNISELQSSGQRHRALWKKFLSISELITQLVWVRLLSMDRSWTFRLATFTAKRTLVTIQIDQMLAELFQMEYTDTDGSSCRPYIIHRTSLGCYERTLALLIEKYAGALPLWIAPTQVKVLPIGDKQQDYADVGEKALGCWNTL